MGRRRNNKGRRSAGAATRMDAWSSVDTGHGTSRDRRESFSHETRWLSPQVAEDIYRGDGMAARCIDDIPEEMIRKGFSVAISSEGGQQDKETSQRVKDALDDLGVVARVKQALCWARAYGGAGIFLGAIDGPDTSQPLNLNAVDSLRWLTVFSGPELQPECWYDDPADPRYGEPSVYRIVPLSRTASGVVDRRVHESRILRFDGVVVSRRHLEMGNGWGDSVLVRLYEELRDFGAAWGGVAHLMTEYGQGVLEVPGLMDILASKQGVASLHKRLSAFQALRSTVRAAVLDGGREGQPGESFRRDPTPLTGVAEVLDRLAQRLAAVADIPVSRLFGQSPGGLANSDEGQLRWFYDRIDARRESELRPALNQLLQVLFRAKTGPTQGVEPESWRVVFPPLREMTDEERAEIRSKQANTDVSYIQAGVLDPSEVAVSRFGGDEWSDETKIDLIVRQEVEASAEFKESGE